MAFKTLAARADQMILQLLEALWEFYMILLINLIEFDVVPNLKKVAGS